MCRRRRRRNRPSGPQAKKSPTLQGARSDYEFRGKRLAHKAQSWKRPPRRCGSCSRCILSGRTAPGCRHPMFASIKTLTHSGRRTPPIEKGLHAVRENLEINFSFPRAVEFGEENTLPAPKGEFAFLDKHELADTYEHSLYMRIRVAFKVPEGTGHRDEAIERAFGIGSNIRIGVFVDEDGSRGMGDVEETSARADIKSGNNALHFVSDIEHLRTANGFHADRLHSFLLLARRESAASEGGRYITLPQHELCQKSRDGDHVMKAGFLEADEFQEFVQAGAAPTSEEWKETEIAGLKALLGIQQIFQKVLVLFDDFFMTIERGAGFVAQFLDLVVDPLFGASDRSLNGRVDCGNRFAQSLDAFLNLAEI